MRWAAIVAALVLAGCGGAARPAPEPAAAARPAATLCTGVRTTVVGHVDAAAATELSGLARTPDGTLWTHNDSGVVRGYDEARMWTRRRGESIARALRRRGCRVPVHLIGEGQGEALALTRDGRAFYTVPEGRSPALRRYRAQG